MKLIGPQIGLGRTSVLLAYGADSVLKVLRPGIPRHWAAIEYEMAQIVFHAGLAVPEPRGLIEYNDRPAIEYQLIPAPTLWDRFVAGEFGVEETAGLLADIHLEITAMKAPKGMPDLAERMTAKIESLPNQAPSEAAVARRLVAQLAAGDRLVHGDLHPGNILLDGTRPIVIDWFDAACGSPAADVVRTSILIRPRPTSCDVAHLPGANRSMLQPLHACYMERVQSLLSPDLSAILLLEGVSALSRLAENCEHDDAALRALWHHALVLDNSMSAGR